MTTKGTFLLFVMFLLIFYSCDSSSDETEPLIGTWVGPILRKQNRLRSVVLSSASEPYYVVLNYVNSSDTIPLSISNSYIGFHDDNYRFVGVLNGIHDKPSGIITDGLWSKRLHFENIDNEWLSSITSNEMVDFKNQLILEVFRTSKGNIDVKYGSDNNIKNNINSSIDGVIINRGQIDFNIAEDKFKLRSIYNDRNGYMQLSYSDSSVFDSALLVKSKITSKNDGNDTLITFLTIFGAAILGSIGILKESRSNKGITSFGVLTVTCTIVLGFVGACTQIQKDRQTKSDYSRQVDLALSGIDKITDVFGNTEELRTQISSQEDSINRLQTRLLNSDEKLLLANTKIIETQENIIDYSENTINTLTGGNSFCYFDPFIIPQYDYTVNPRKLKYYNVQFRLKIEGEFDIQNISYTLCDAFKNILKQDSNVDCIHGRVGYVAGSKLKPNWQPIKTVEFIVDADEVDLIYDVELNIGPKIYSQSIRLVRSEELGFYGNFRWHTAYTVSKKQYHKEGNRIETSYKTIKEEASTEFPRFTSSGKINLGGDTLMSFQSYYQRQQNILDRINLGKDTSMLKEYYRQHPLPPLKD